MQEKGYLPPGAVLLEPTGKINAVKLDFRNEEAKKQSMQKLDQLARDKEAAAAITIADTTYRMFPPEGNQLSTPTENPDLAEAYKPDGKPRKCISMDIKVEGQATTNVMVAYWRDILGNIVFGPPEEGPIEFTGPEPPQPEGDEGPMD